VKRTLFPVTVHLFFIRENEILMARRLNTGYRDGEYSVPAGHLDGGETVMQAGIREALEEVGVQLREEDISITSVMHRLDGEERVDFFLQIHRWDGEPVNAEPDKCDDLRWVHFDELPENTIPYIRRAITNHLKDIQIDEFGW